ncbi:regulator of chromosome condensation 1/beta-lactamase-inhibitor protein II [Pelagophyceae sp. CCMP2097]|nr:regulator of chromosome condensation 1/beta-lactamase-inhibitor protein II [Pelagophyceae sp. CCMP2097]|mmetsp:Transcript_18082/g.64313  ORF Transcript_18082/g.64313 Transcript_18082/m.64313 type:complete len:526 (+) Transcript_18082:72-1649(+)
MKRGNEDSQLSRREYDLNMSDTSGAGSFAVAGADELAQRRMAKSSTQAPWRARAETPLSARLFSSRVLALNKGFAAWATAQLKKEPDVAILEAARDYVSYASALEQQFLTEHTDVLSFGSGDCGQLAHGMDDDRDTIVPKPRRILALRSKLITVVSCGGLHNAAVTADGLCYTWGCNDEGSLGRGGEEDVPQIVELPAKDDPVVQVAAGDTQTFAVTASGACYGWGCYKDKEGKQWFDVGFDSSLKPKRKQTTPLLVFRAGVVIVRCGAAYNVALLSDGCASTWGIGEIGELGRPARDLKGADGEYDLAVVVGEHLTPGRVDLPGRCKVKAIGAGAYHSLYATESRVFASGLNNYGQLGVGDSTDVKLPISIPSLEGAGVVAVDGGQHHSLVLCGDGTVYAFGRADYGQLGIGQACTSTGNFVALPTEVKFVDAAKPAKRAHMTSISAGSNHNLVLTNKGAVWSWGYGDMNALGLGASRDEPEPKLVSFGGVVGTGDQAQATVTLVAGGGQHSVVCAHVKEFKAK